MKYYHIVEINNFLRLETHLRMLEKAATWHVHFSLMYLMPKFMALHLIHVSKHLYKHGGGLDHMKMHQGGSFSLEGPLSYDGG
jgi:hypothetical protein